MARLWEVLPRVTFGGPTPTLVHLGMLEGGGVGVIGQQLDARVLDVGGRS